MRSSASSLCALSKDTLLLQEPQQTSWGCGSAGLAYWGLGPRDRGLKEAAGPRAAPRTLLGPLSVAIPTHRVLAADCSPAEVASLYLHPGGWVLGAPTQKAGKTLLLRVVVREEPAGGF